MTHLHTYITSRQVLYLGISDAPAWVVVKANDCEFRRPPHDFPFSVSDIFLPPDARSHGLTPFSVYQGRWNAAFRDVEAEIVPMCEDQGMAIVPWAALGGGQLITAEQRKQAEADGNSRPFRYEPSESDVKVCEVLEEIAEERKTTMQAIVNTPILSSIHLPLLDTDVAIGALIPPRTIPSRLSHRRCADRCARTSHACRTEHQSHPAGDPAHPGREEVRAVVPRQLSVQFSRRSGIPFRPGRGRPAAIPDGKFH